MEVSKEMYKEVAVKRYCPVHGAVEHLSNSLLIDTCPICGLPLYKVRYCVSNIGTGTSSGSLFMETQKNNENIENRMKQIRKEYIEKYHKSMLESSQAILDRRNGNRNLGIDLKKMEVHSWQ